MPWFCVGAEPKTSVFTVFFLFREREKSRKHRLFDAFCGLAKTVDLTIFGGLEKVPTTKITTTTTTGPSSNSYNML